MTVQVAHQGQGNPQATAELPPKFEAPEPRPFSNPFAQRKKCFSMENLCALDALAETGK